MRSLVDDLRHAATPLTITSREDLVGQVKAAHAALLRAALATQDRATDDFPLDTSDLVESLRSYALWLEDVALDSQQLPDTEKESVFNLAATLYEFVGGLSAIPHEQYLSIFRPPLNDYLRSAVLGSFTGYQAQSSLVARRVVKYLRQINPSSAVGRLHNAVAMVIALYLGREFHDTFVQAQGLRALVVAAIYELQLHDAVNHEYLEVDRAAALGLGCSAAAAGMLVGASANVLEAATDFDHIAQATIDSLDAEHYWLASRLTSITRHMNEASMHHVLGRADIPIGFRRALARDGVFELWKPQLEAIEKGLLGTGIPRNFVITLPTGAGKTLVAELAILTALHDTGQRWAVYITPSRALVNQVSHDLRRRLADTDVIVRTVLAGAEQNDLFDEELQLLAEEKCVTVTTPEKLDAYYRNDKTLFDRCSLVIFDEVHKVGEPGRGELLESLITRFVAYQPQTQLMLLSGVLSNHEELVNWLGDINTSSIAASRRPTRQVRGVAVRYSPQYGMPQINKTGETIRRVDFSGGLVLVHEEEDLQGVREVNVPDLFTGYFTEKLFRNNWREDYSANHSSFNDHAVGIARQLSKTSGTTLVFVQYPQWAESCCRNFDYKPLEQYQADRELLARLVASELGDAHPLVNYCKLGFAFHHARLPTSVQRAVELGLEEGWLKVVFATSTLREGLNTAATNVVLAGNTYRDANAVHDVSPPDFENLAGRAGRPYRETEGRVLLVPDSLAIAKVVTVGRKYLLVGEEALRVQSQLDEFARTLARSQGNVHKMPEAQQSLFLGLIAAGLIDETDFGRFFEQSFWLTQEIDPLPSRRAARACAAIRKNMEESVGSDRLQVAARTGLSFTSSERLREVLVAKSHVFDDIPLVSEQERAPELLAPLLEASLWINEVRKGALKRDVPWEVHLDPVRSWIANQSYSDILAVARTTGAVKANAKVEDIVKYCSDVSTWLSWAFGACYTILSSLAESPDAPIDFVHPWVGVVPLLVKYGVSSRVAAFVSLLGVSDRKAAQTLGDEFLKTGKAITLGEVSAWMAKAADQLDDIFPHRDLRGEILRRQVFGMQRKRLPYVNATVRARGKLARGQVVQFAPLGDEGISALDYKGNAIGIVGDSASILNIAQGRLDAIVGIVTRPTGVEGGMAHIAAILQSSG